MGRIGGKEMGVSVYICICTYENSVYVYMKLPSDENVFNLFD